MKRQRARLLEGEVLGYSGIGWVVKGFQHPEGLVVAYPRYDLLGGRRLEKWEAMRAESLARSFWDCIERAVPLIPAGAAAKIACRSGRQARIAATLADLLDVERDSVEPTGSGLIGLEDAWDLDFVIYGAGPEVVDRLRRLVEHGAVERASAWELYLEHRRKHQGAVDLETYLAIKRNSLLHLRMGGERVNLKLYRFSSGALGCADRVIGAWDYRGVVKIREPVSAPLLPATYLAEAGAGELTLETHRELYAELEPGLYYVEGRLEVRNSGLYLVPDFGTVRPLRS